MYKFSGFYWPLNLIKKDDITGDELREYWAQAWKIIEEHKKNPETGFPIFGTLNAEALSYDNSEEPGVVGAIECQDRWGRINVTGRAENSQENYVLLFDKPDEGDEKSLIRRYSLKKVNSGGWIGVVKRDQDSSMLGFMELSILPVELDFQI